MSEHVQKQTEQVRASFSTRKATKQLYCEYGVGRHKTHSCAAAAAPSADDDDDDDGVGNTKMGRSVGALCFGWVQG